MIQVVSMAALLQVMVVGLSGLPPRAAIAALPETATKQAVDFNGMAQLIGYDIRRQGQQLTIDWYWRRADQIDHPYVVFNHVLDAQGQIAAQQDGPPQAGQPLMTCWQPNEVYQDQHVIELKSDAPPGPYAVELGLYNAQTNQRVPVLQSDGTQTDHVVIELP